MLDEHCITVVRIQVPYKVEYALNNQTTHAFYKNVESVSYIVNQGWEQKVSMIIKINGQQRSKFRL